MSKKTMKRVLAIVLLIVLAIAIGFGVEYVYSENATRTASISIETDQPTSLYTEEDAVGYHKEEKSEDRFAIDGADPNLILQLSGNEQINSAIVRLSQPAEQNIPIKIYLREKDKIFSESLASSRVISQGLDSAVFTFPAGKYYQIRIDNGKSLYLDSVETINGEVTVSYQNPAFRVTKALLFSVISAVILLLALGIITAVRSYKIPSGIRKCIQWNYLMALGVFLISAFLVNACLSTTLKTIRSTTTTFYQQEYGNYARICLTPETTEFPFQVEDDRLIRVAIRCYTTNNNQGTVEYAIVNDQEEAICSGALDLKDIDEKQTLSFPVEEGALLKEGSYTMKLSAHTEQTICVYRNKENGLKTIQTFVYSKGKTVSVVAYALAALFVLGLVFYLIFQRKMTTETAFLILAFSIGIMAVFINPPFNSWDEVRHFTRPWDMTQGVLFTKADLKSGFPYANIPRDAVDLRLLVQTPKFGDFNQAREVVFTSKWVEALSMPRSEKTQWTSQLAVNRFTPFVYLPQILGISVGRLCKLPALWILYLTRLINMSVAVLLGYYALKKTPAYKNIFILTFFFPALIWSRSSCSTDGVLFSLILMIIAVAMDTRVKGKMEKKDLILVSVCSFFIALIKLPYVLFVFAAIGVSFYPANKRRVSAFWICCLLVVLSIVLYFGLSSLMSRGIVESTPQALPITKVGRLLQYPKQMLSLLLYYFNNNIGAMLEQGIGAESYTTLTLAMTVLIACTSKDLEINGKTNGWYRVLYLCIVFALVMVIEFVFYEVSSHNVVGIQGRYLQPLFPLFLMALCCGTEKSEHFGKTLTFSYSMFLFTAWALRFIQAYWIG